jgi:hypothetical protein
MHTGRFLYAVNQTAATGGSISVYDIGAGHRLVKTIETVRDVDDVRGVAASIATGRLYVAYRTRSGVGMIYCLNVYDDAVLWNRAIDPDVDRLAIHPGGQLLYAPTYEGRSADFINVLDASTGDVVRKVHFSNRSHDTLFPVSGPLFQETKAEDGSGNYLYTIDPQSYAVSRIGPYAGILGPYAVDGMSRYVVNNVTGPARSPSCSLRDGIDERIAANRLWCSPGVALGRRKQAVDGRQRTNKHNVLAPHLAYAMRACPISGQARVLERGQTSVSRGYRGGEERGPMLDIAATKSTGNSAITNGTRLHSRGDTDGRTREARRFRDLVDLFAETICADGLLAR